MESINNSDTTKIKRCAHDGCDKKLKMVDFPCRCEKTYCALHRHSVSHNCTFDYKQHGKVILEKTVVACKHEKVIMI